MNNKLINNIKTILAFMAVIIIFNFFMRDIFHHNYKPKDILKPLSYDLLTLWKDNKIEDIYKMYADTQSIQKDSLFQAMNKVNNYYGNITSFKYIGIYKGKNNLLGNPETYNIKYNLMFNEKQVVVTLECKELNNNIVFNSIDLSPFLKPYKPATLGYKYFYIYLRK